MDKALQFLRKKWKKINKNSKLIMRIGFFAFLSVLIAATILAAIDYFIGGYHEAIVLIIKSLITTSFYLLAEFIVGALVVDYVFQ